MTATQLRLMDQAQDYWDQGKHLPLDLFARMAQEGLDVETLELKNIKEPY